MSRPAEARPPALLVLAGSAEARALLEALAPEAAAGRLRLIASLAGATRAPRALPAEVRSGGFGGPEAMAAWLGAEGVEAVVDATHPFAARISANAAAACAAAGVARLALVRPGWGGAAPRAPSLAAALAALPPGARALAATGRASAPAMAEAAAARPDLRLWLRAAEPFAPAPEGVELIVARPPHAPEAERALFARLRLTHLVAKDSGGADAAKLAAAEAAGLGLILIARPPPPPGPRAPDAAAAEAWARRALGLPPPAAGAALAP